MLSFLLPNQLVSPFQTQGRLRCQALEETKKTLSLLAHKAGVKSKIFKSGRGIGNDYLQVNLRVFQYTSHMHGKTSVVQLDFSLAPKHL